MTFTSQIILWVLGIGYSVIAALLGLIYKALTSRIASLEERFGNSDDVWEGKMPTIIASATRLDELEKRIGRLEDNLQRWMERVEDKIDGLVKKGV
jgi:hypothetical protein